MLTDEEHMGASSGQGVEIAEYRIAAAMLEPDPVSGVAHLLAAIDALSLHLHHVSAAADLFQRQTDRNGSPRLPSVRPDELDIAAK